MEKNEKLNLINGSFSQEEAKEILLNMITSKINYHDMKSWSSMERFGKSDATSEKRIIELKNEMIKLETILKRVEKSDKKLLINSDIFISIEED